MCTAHGHRQATSAEELLSLRKLLPEHEVRQLFPVSKSTLYRLVTEGQFPAPVYLRGCRFWPVCRLRRWWAQLVRDA
jgi:predicted DNA-binding transcriptional regulator AlpA